MEEDGTEPRPGIIAGQGRKETAKTGEDGGGWYRTPTWHHSWTREEGDGQDRRRWRRMVQNPDLASSPGQGRKETPKTGEDGGGWYRTRPGIISWTREEGDGQDRRRWRRMVQNPDLASFLDKGARRCQDRRRWRRSDGTEP